MEEIKRIVGAEVAQIRPDYDDSDIERFARARKYNVQAAVEMIRAHLKWYQENKVKDIVVECATSDKYKFLRGYMPSTHDIVYGLDRSGEPYFIERGGSLDARGVFKRYNETELIKFHIYQQERRFQLRKEAGKRLGRPVTASYLIQDMMGLSSSHLYKPALVASKAFVVIDEKDYPETLKAMFIIRAPTIFTGIWKMFKPFIDENTLTKLKILGYDFQAELQKAIDPTQLPVEYSGSNPKPLTGGGLAGDDGDKAAQTVTVSNRHVVVVDIKEPGSTLCWDFRTESNDIAFGILFGANGETVIEPSVRYDCSVEPCQGQVVCKQAGRYHLAWDNSYSLFKSKKLTFRLELYLPNQADVVVDSNTAL